MTTGNIEERLSGDLGRIAGVLGVRAALKLSREFGGVCLYIRGAGPLRRELRDAKIREDYEGGIPVPVIALKYGLTQRWVRTVLKRG